MDRPSSANRDCAEMFEATKLDLNNDRVQEIRIRGKYGGFCSGTGDCSEWVFGLDREIREISFASRFGWRVIYRAENKNERL